MVLCYLVYVRIIYPGLNSGVGSILYELADGI